MADTLAELEGWEGEVLGMIAATLTAIGCRHEGGQESTPPMMYDDWIKCAVGKREDDLRALRESHDALVEALRTLLSCEELEMQTYGSFPGGDPRCFTPDEKVNTPEELAAWKAACEAWDRGEGQDTGPQCQTMGDGSVVTGTGFGMGVTRWQHPAAIEARAALAKAEALHE